MGEGTGEGVGEAEAECKDESVMGVSEGGRVRDRGRGSTEVGFESGSRPR